jgi:tRNA(Leu) C34 or U34 (ribose-2'-O)-methylase TrmL
MNPALYQCCKYHTEHRLDGAGSETSGLPEAAHSACRASAETGGGLRRIPINETHVRSLNLSVAAGIGLYEAQRQTDLAAGIAKWRSEQERSY